MENYTKKLLIRMLLLLFIIFFSKDLVYPIIEFLTVRLSYLFLLPLKPILTTATTISIQQHIIEIIPACVAFSAYVLLASLILITKDISRNKLVKMFIYGGLSILIINIIRIDALVYLLVLTNSGLFETIHLFFWKILSGVIVVLIWIVLTRKYNITSIPAYSDLKYLIKRIR